MHAAELAVRVDELRLLPEVRAVIGRHQAFEIGQHLRPGAGIQVDESAGRAARQILAGPAVFLRGGNEWMIAVVAHRRASRLATSTAAAVFGLGLLRNAACASSTRESSA